MFQNILFSRKMSSIHQDKVPGERPMNIQGRLNRQRERLLGMTDEERAWRKQWVKDQHLSPNEPRVVPEIYYELNNPIRRFYKAPLNYLFSFTVPYLGQIGSDAVRYVTGKFLIGGFAGVMIMYWLKYNENTWERMRGWRISYSRMAVYPGEEGYPKGSEKVLPQDFNERGFKKSPI